MCRGERKRVQKEMSDTAGLVGPKAANLWVPDRAALMGVSPTSPNSPEVPIVAAKGAGR